MCDQTYDYMDKTEQEFQFLKEINDTLLIFVNNLKN